MTTRRTVLSGALALIAAPALAEQAASYRSELERAYSGPADPLEVHARALAEIRNLHGRADVLLKRHGLAHGSAPERIAALFGEARYLYPDSDAGRDRAVADMNARVAGIRPRLPEALGDLPVGAAEVRRMTATDAAAGKAGFRVPPKDGQTGIYYVDLKDIRKRPIWSLPSVAYHEVIPGHLLQLPLQAAANPPPERVKASGAYFEAWGIYAEQLARDLGAFAHDPLAEVGYLHWRLFRMGRVVADTGLHALGWSVPRAIAEMRRIQGPDIAFVTVEADAARMAKQPGRFAADGLGALSLAAWRPKERAHWPAFHKAVLAEGPWPFGELEKRVRA